MNLFLTSLVACFGLENIAFVSFHRKRLASRSIVVPYGILVLLYFINVLRLLGITMRLNSWILLLLLSLTGCAAGQKVIQVSKDRPVNAIEFTQMLISKMPNMGVDSLVARARTKSNTTNGITEISTEFFPAGGLSAVTNNFRSYCESMSGHWMNNFCVDDEKAKVLLQYTGKIVNSSVGGKVSLDVFVPVSNEGNQHLLQFAKNNGYLSVSEIKDKEIEQEKMRIAENKRRLEEENKRIKEEKLREALRQKALQEKLAKQEYIFNKSVALRREASKKTREKVKIAGTKICYVYWKFSLSSSPSIPAFTERYSNGKIKYSIGNNVSWDKIENWYECENGEIRYTGK